MKKRNDLDYANSQPNENELTIKSSTNTVLGKQLAWFNNFVDYVGNIDSNLYNEACEYADEREDC
tara:strand:- start:852 stop:1046 length:195 start_codon:yes stop_codon:yes gene_type:complete